MPYFIGTDEAGYGPNLGPLVITATAWRVPDRVLPDELYERLVAVVTSEPRLTEGDRRVQLSDSKLLYQPRGTLAGLERGVLAACGVLDRPAIAWRDAWLQLAADCRVDLDAEPWFGNYIEPLPIACPADEVRCAARFLSDGLSACGIQLVDIRCRVLFPTRFNDLVDDHGSKGAVLSQSTLELARDVMRPLEDEPTLVICDKHGGRNKYGPLLQALFPEPLVEVRKESRAESVYRWGRQPRRVEVRFVAKGEGFLPAALASMVSKYLRELAMRAFNGYWSQHVPELQPTAGYPGDATRFKQDIASAQARLGITDRMLWRCR